jgi:hypothetical protein
MASPRSHFVLAAALAVTALLVWLAFSSGDGRVDIERRGLSGPTTGTEGAAPSGPLAPTDVAELAAPESAAVNPARREATEPAAANAAAGLRFDELLRPRFEFASEPLDEFDVLVIAPDGSQRVAAARDLVLERDLEAGGLLVVRAPRACPRFLDAARLAAIASSAVAPRAARPEPLDLPLAAAASLVVEVTAPPEGRARPDTFVLAGAPSSRETRTFIRSEMPDLEDAESRAAGRAALRDLASGALDADARRSALVRARSAAEYADATEPAVDPTRPADELGFLAPWLDRYVRDGTSARLVLEPVPANTDLSLHVPWHEALSIAPHAPPFARIDAQCGRLGTSPFQIPSGQVEELTVAHETLGGFRGRLPVEAGTPWLVSHGFSLQYNEANSSGSASVGLGALVVAPDGSFECLDALAGSHSVAAQWREPDGVTRYGRRAFELAPGEFLDLGELSNMGDGRLTVVARFATDDGADALPSGRAFESLQVYADLRPQNAPHGPNVARLVLRHGHTTVVDRLAPGSYALHVRGTQRMAPATRADAPAALDEAFVDDWLANTVLPEPGIVVVDAPIVAPVELAPDAHLELGIAVAETGVCRLDVAVEPHLCIPNLRVCAWFVRRDGQDVRVQEAFGWEGLPGSRGRATSATTLPLGEWTVVTLLELPGSAEIRPLHHVALDRVVVSGSDPVELRPVLEPSAALRFQGRASRHLSYAEFPHWDLDMAREFRVEGALVVTALLPGRDVLLPGGSSVRTGPAGSTVDAP